MAEPHTHDIVIRQSTTFRKSFVYAGADKKPYNLTGYSARMHVRKKLKDANTLLVLSTATGGGIVIEGTVGRINIEIPEDVTAALPVATCVYDLMLTPPNSTDIIPIVEGLVEIKDSVTRDD